MSEHEHTTPVVMRYRGDGTLRIPGVPRRDLTKADVDRLPPAALREAMASPLYAIEAGVHLPLNRSATEDAPPVVPDETGDAPDGSGETGRKQRRTAGGDA
jgi:hypothetical protein